MKEIVVISGKGGAGKTSIMAAFAHLARPCVVADCDVDAADLHLVLTPTTMSKGSFSGGKEARIRPGHCTACGKCAEICVYEAISFDGPGNGQVEKTFRIDPTACEGCGLCAYFCPVDAVDFSEATTGSWFLSSTRVGQMAHARLNIAAENSGKLVTLVREKAREEATRRKADLILIDGPPGIGCPVIASITGADAVVLVAEPTKSGYHDVERALVLTKHFDIPALLIINKRDINEDIALEIEAWAQTVNVPLVGSLPFDSAVVAAQIREKTITEHAPKSAISEELEKAWKRILSKIE